MFKMHHFSRIAFYEFKIQQRSWLFRLFAICAIGGIFWQEFIWRGGCERSELIVSSSYIPFECAYLYNFLQSLIVVFVMTGVPRRHERYSAMEVFDVRPAGNLVWMAGIMAGVGGVFVLLNVCVMLCGLCVNLLLSDAPFSWYLYFFYFLTLNLPVLLFMAGFSVVIATLVRNRGISLILSLLFLLMTYKYLYRPGDGIWDMWCRWLPNIFSDLSGHPNLGIYLLQRSQYALLGVGLLFCYSVLIPRLEDRGRRGVRGIAALLMGTGGVVCGMFYMQDFSERSARRAEYRDIYLKYSTADKLRILSHDLVCTLKQDSIYAVSSVEVTNQGTMLVERPVFYLNPWLQVIRVRKGGEVVHFEREGQAIVFHERMQPGEEWSLDFEYGGRIDETVVYLDIPDEECLDALRSEVGRKRMFYREGWRFAFLERDYAQLVPECLWYPVCVPPVNLCSLFSVEKNITPFTLKVVNRNPGGVVSQGHREERGDTSVFISSRPLSGIMLCAGDFGHKSMTFERYNLDVYYSNQHKYMFEGYSMNEDELKRFLEDRFLSMERRAGEHNCFERLMFVEISLSSFFPERSWGLGTGNVQPGVLQLRERGADLHNSLDVGVYKREMRKLFKSEKDDVEYEKTFLGEFLTRQSNETSFFTSSSRGIFSAKYPAVGYLLEKIVADQWNQFIAKGFYDEDYYVVDYLSRKSLREALRDSSLSAVQMQKMMKLAGADFQAKLSVLVPWGRVVLFMQKFKEMHSFQEVDFDVFLEDFYREFNVDLVSLLDDCYSRNKLPVYMIRDVVFERDAEENVYYGNFYIYNDGDVDGVVSVMQNSSFSDMPEGVFCGLKMPCTYHLIRSHEGIHLREKYPSLPQFTLVNTNLSGNLPFAFSVENISWSQEEQVVGNTTDTGTGARRLDKSAFLPESREHIVDNEDPGFSLIESSDKWIWSLFREKSEKEYVTTSRSGQGWFVNQDFYGYPVKSAYIKRRGTGKWRAQWTTEMEKEGTYEVFVYLKNKYYFSKGSRYYYTVYYGEEKEEKDMLMEVGDQPWMSLGCYYFPKGKAKIELDDRGRNEKLLKMHDYVVADAVKWVYKDGLKK